MLFSSSTLRLPNRIWIPKVIPDQTQERKEQIYANGIIKCDGFLGTDQMTIILQDNTIL